MCDGLFSDHFIANLLRNHHHHTVCVECEQIGAQRSSRLLYHRVAQCQSSELGLQGVSVSTQLGTTWFPTACLCAVENNNK